MGSEEFVLTGGEEAREERRRTYVFVPSDLIARVDEHIQKEDEQQRRHEELLSQGNVRMTKIEGDIQTAAAASKAAATTSARYVKLISLLAGSLLGLSLWVVKEQHADIKTILGDFKVAQAGDARRGEQLGEMIGIVKTLAERVNQHQSEIDKINDRLLTRPRK